MLRRFCSHPCFTTESVIELKFASPLLYGSYWHESEYQNTLEIKVRMKMHKLSKLEMSAVKYLTVPNQIWYYH